MKKLILSTMGLVLGAALGYAQGTITINNGGSAFFISTNSNVNIDPTTGQMSSPGGGAIGNTVNISSNYYFTVLATPFYTGGGTALAATPSTNLFTSLSSWTWTGDMGTNLGGFGNAGKLQSPVSYTTPGSSWAQPSGASYGTGTTNYFVIVGWSVNEGSSWLTVSNEIATGTLVAGGYYGTSVLGYEVSGGGPSSLSAVNLFGTAQTGIAGGLAHGFQLDLIVATPEPGTIALAGLGGLTLLLFRRRK